MALGLPTPEASETPTTLQYRGIEGLGGGCHLTFGSATLGSTGRDALTWVSTFLHCNLPRPQLGSTVPRLVPSVKPWGKGKKRRGGTDLQVPEEAGDSAGFPITWESHSPPIAGSKGSWVELPEPHTPAMLLMRTGSLVSMTEPRSHEGAWLCHDVPSTTTLLLWLLQLSLASHESKVTGKDT